jgi:cobalamin biosynthesis protein CbiD
MLNFQLLSPRLRLNYTFKVPESETLKQISRTLGNFGLETPSSLGVQMRTDIIKLLSRLRAEINSQSRSKLGAKKVCGVCGRLEGVARTLLRQVTRALEHILESVSVRIAEHQQHTRVQCTRVS